MKRTLNRIALLGAFVCLLSLTPLGSATAGEPVRVAQACGWYVVLGCFQRYRAAQRRARDIGVIVVDTNDYPNFRNGWFCAVDGPYSRGRANQLRRNWRGTVADAYAKAAC